MPSLHICLNKTFIQTALALSHALSTFSIWFDNLIKTYNICFSTVHSTNLTLCCTSKKVCKSATDMKSGWLICLCVYMTGIKTQNLFYSVLITWWTGSIVQDVWPAHGTSYRTHQNSRCHSNHHPLPESLITKSFHIVIQ